MADTAIPVIAIDGPSASGKGTVAREVARALNFHLLDSGSLYRLVALAALKSGIAWDNAKALEDLAIRLNARFAGDDIIMDNHIVTEEIRSEACSQGASRVAAVPEVRQALLLRQRAFKQSPGLVADGRDMGTVVFPEAGLKVFLTAGVEARAERRHKQLKQKGIAAIFAVLLEDLRARDERDMSRSAAPLKPSPDAFLLDTTDMTAAAATEQVLAWYRASKQSAG
jgi:cytidylate kinase